MHSALEVVVTFPGGRIANLTSELDDIEQLIGLYRARVLRYVAFSIGDQDLAETITQDCFLKAYNARASFRGECAVSTWLFGIANNLIRDRLRRKAFHFWRHVDATSLDVAEMANFLPNGQSSPESRLLAKERLKQVAEVIEKLSATQRRVFLLKFSEELDLEEISLCTGMHVTTVKTHLYRAVRAVRRALGADA